MSFIVDFLADESWKSGDRHTRGVFRIKAIRLLGTKDSVQLFFLSVSFVSDEAFCIRIYVNRD